MSRRRILHLLNIMGRLAGGGGASYDADASTLFAAMSSQPDATRKALINTTILALKSAGIWTLLDECWFMAAHDSQAGLLGWKRYKNLTAVNAPTFTTDRGFAGNGTTSYLNTGFVPSTDGVQYALNDASLGTYSRTNVGGSMADIGARNSGEALQVLISSRLGDKYMARLNVSSAVVSLGSSTDSRGLFVGRRPASNSQRHLLNGVDVAGDAIASTGVPTRALYIGAFNDNGTANLFGTRQYAFGMVGASMSAQQQADLFTIVEAYLDAIGAGVI